MQRSWREDGDKLTFIIALLPTSLGSQEEVLVGDINLFLSPLEPDFSDEDQNENDTKMVVGEVELMLALPSSRGKGYGSLALRGFLRYVALHLEEVVGEYGRWIDGEEKGEAEMEAWKMQYLRAKIQESNKASLRVFEKQGFVRTNGGRVNYFGEVEVRLGIEELMGRYCGEKEEDGYREVDIIEGDEG